MRRYAAILLLVSVSWGGWWKQDEDCDGDVCFPARIELDLYKPAASRSGLSYRETIEVTSSVRDILNICLPNTDPSFVANNFVSCEGKAMKTVCKMAKRNWLVNTENNETVANVDLLLSNLNDLTGAEEAVRECLQVPEEYEEYYYDYDYYYDDYDYLEEPAGGLRVRREAGRRNGKEGRTGRGKGGKGGKKCRNGNGPGCRSAKRNSGGKGKGRNDDCKKNDPRKKCNKKRQQRKKKDNQRKGNECKNGRKCRNNPNKKPKKVKGKRPPKRNEDRRTRTKKNDKKEKNKNKEEKPEDERKGRKYKNKKPDNKEKVDKEVNAMLSSLGLASLPSKSDLDSLHCVYHQLANLVRDCAQNKLNE